MTKRSLALLLCGMLIGSMFLTVRLPLAADETVQKSAEVKTAYFNLSVVVKGYDRYQNFSSEMKEKMSGFEARMRKSKRDLDLLVREIGTPELTPEEKGEIEKKIRDTQRRLEDINNEGKRAIGKATDEQLVTMYRDVLAVAADYAREHDLDAVMHYNDAPAKSPESMTPENIARKMQAGAVMPVYLAPRADITEKILKELNARYERGQ